MKESMMRTFMTAICALLLTAGAHTTALAGEAPTAGRAEALRKYGLDPATPLASRVGAVRPDIVRMMAEDNGPKVSTHVLTSDERRKLTAAFAELTPLHRRVLQERLRTISFADGLPHTALTSTVNPGEPYPLFDITFRAGVLQETVSQFLTNKERGCFDTAGSSLSVAIVGGSLDAIVYVLLHEATHVVDLALGVVSGDQVSPTAGSIADGVWSNRLTAAPPYRQPLLESTAFRHTGKVMSITRAREVYTALGRTPFASLYGSSNWGDDVAELVAWYDLTQKLKQPYRIELRDQGRVVFTYAPMDAPLVRSRFRLVERFYENAPG
jgi:hypothetical protein